MFGFGKSRGKTSSPVDPNPNQEGSDPNSPYTLRTPQPWGQLPIYHHNTALSNYRAFHYGEQETLPGRLYGTYSPWYRRAASDTVGVVAGQ